MVNVHVAHDCMIGDKIIIANNTILGGHSHVESHVTISGGVGIHPFVTIGSYSYVGALSRIYHDVPRFMMVDGNPSQGPLHQRGRAEAPRHRLRRPSPACTRPTG